jgi:hypothetical protein
MLSVRGGTEAAQTIGAPRVRNNADTGRKFAAWSRKPGCFEKDLSD